MKITNRLFTAEDGNRGLLPHIAIIQKFLACKRRDCTSPQREEDFIIPSCVAVVHQAQLQKINILSQDLCVFLIRQKS